MKGRINMTINVKGNLMDLSIPKVMGILNITPDSFYSDSRVVEKEQIRVKTESMIKAGVNIMDVGGCSTRPGYSLPSEKEEWERVDLGCEIVREIAPSVPLSIDTFRSSVALKAIEKWGVDIINDVSGGTDEGLWQLAADKHVVYVLTHNRENGSTEYGDVTAEVIKELSWKLHEIRRLGVCDVIIDPGFGFAKTLVQNYALLDKLHEVVLMGCPVLVGVSRKSMIYKTLGCNPKDALVGSIALGAIALEKGAGILRVHDVKETVDTVKLFCKMKNLTI